MIKVTQQVDQRYCLIDDYHDHATETHYFYIVIGGSGYSWGANLCQWHLAELQRKIRNALSELALTDDRNKQAID